MKKDNYYSFKLVVFKACEIVYFEPEAQIVCTFSYLGRCTTSRARIDTPAFSFLSKNLGVNKSTSNKYTPYLHGLTSDSLATSPSLLLLPYCHHSPAAALLWQVFSFIVGQQELVFSSGTIGSAVRGFSSSLPSHTLLPPPCVLLDYGVANTA